MLWQQKTMLQTINYHLLSEDSVWVEVREIRLKETKRLPQTVLLVLLFECFTFFVWKQYNSSFHYLSGFVPLCCRSQRTLSSDFIAQIVLQFFFYSYMFLSSSVKLHCKWWCMLILIIKRLLIPAALPPVIYLLRNHKTHIFQLDLALRFYLLHIHSQKSDNFL